MRDDQWLEAYNAGRLEILAKVEGEARRYAAMYGEGSDGRNTFLLFADYVAAVGENKR